MMQSCVTNNLDDCPDAVRYAIAFKYTLHTEESGRFINGEYDRFYEDVDKLFIYVFDATTKLCVYADTATVLAPFEDDFVYPIPLNVGKYNIITWGWGRNEGSPSLKMSTAIIPTVVPNVTTIDDARLQLEEAVVNNQLEKIFYSETRDMEISPFISRIDTLPLMNISNTVRIVLEDMRTAKLQDEITISITGDDGAYLFNSISNSKAGSYPGDEGYFKSRNNAPDLYAGIRSDVTYNPYVVYRTDSILKADPIHIRTPYTGSGRDSMLVVEISSLRFVQDNREMKIDINWDEVDLNGKTDHHTFQIPLVKILEDFIANTMNSTRIQYNLDRVHRWQINFKITDTYVTASISIMNWHNKNNPADLGGILQ